jgi:transposase InsO family protein
MRKYTLKITLYQGEAQNSLDDYFNFYNTERPHQALGYRTPYEVYFQKRRET